MNYFLFLDQITRSLARIVEYQRTNKTDVGYVIEKLGIVNDHVSSILQTISTDQIRHFSENLAVEDDETEIAVSNLLKLSHTDVVESQEDQVERPAIPELSPTEDTSVKKIGLLLLPLTVTTYWERIWLYRWQMRRKRWTFPGNFWMMTIFILPRTTILRIQNWLS